MIALVGTAAGIVAGVVSFLFSVWWNYYRFYSSVDEAVGVAASHRAGAWPAWPVMFLVLRLRSLKEDV